MDAIECITGRMSIRAFKPEPAPKEILTAVIDAARYSPSYKNSQPWEVMVLSGEKKTALSKLLLRLLEEGVEACPDLPAPEGWPEAESARIDHLFRSRFEATGVDLTTPEMVRKSKVANFKFYGAPHAIYLYQDSSLSDWSLFDLGLFAQSLMLAANAKGLGTVPQAFATDYAAQTKEFLGLPESKRLVLGISIGFPVTDSPMNALRTDRSGVDEFVRWEE